MRQLCGCMGWGLRVDREGNLHDTFPAPGGAGLLAAHAVACEGPPPQKAPGAREAAAQGHFGRGKAADSGLPPDARFAGGVRAGAGPGVSGVCLREGRRGAARGQTARRA